MKTLNIIYTDQESTAKGCVARMVVKRKCNIAKVINKRVDRTHQGKVHIKRTQDEVAALPLKDSEQAFAVGTSGWFTSDGKQHAPTGKIKSKRSHFYMNKIAKLESELKKKEDIIKLSKKVTSKMKKKISEQEEELGDGENEKLNVVVNDIIRSTKRKPALAKKGPKTKQKGSNKKKEQTTSNGKGTKRKIAETKRNDKTKENRKEQHRKEKCPHDHNNYGYTFTEEWNSRYFAKDAALFGAKCMLCKKIISDTAEDGSIVLTMLQPVWVCGGRNHYHCKMSLCNICYNEKIVLDQTRSRRKRNAN